MITSDKYFKYDYDRHEYYLTIEGALDNVTYTEVELTQVLKTGDLSKTLKLASRRLYRGIYSKNYNRQVMQYKIYLNVNNERESLLEAIVEYIKGAYESGMDLNTYMGEGNDLPQSVYELIGQNLLYQGQISVIDIPEYGSDY